MRLVDLARTIAMVITVATVADIKSLCITEQPDACCEIGGWPVTCCPDQRSCSIVGMAGDAVTCCAITGFRKSRSDQAEFKMFGCSLGNSCALLRLQFLGADCQLCSFNKK